MDYILKNEMLALRVSSLGGEMRSIQSADGTEYLWQGDPAFWKGRAPVLFPFIGRLWNKTYTMDGQALSMDIHGFFRESVLAAAEAADQKLVLTLTDNETTRAAYPRAFRASLTYALEGSTVQITFRVENTGDKTMYFAYGNHPGFNVPLAAGRKFEEYYLEFGKACQPVQVGLSAQAFIQGPDTPYTLEDGRRLPLRHSLFNNDAVILRNMDREVSIRCAGDSHSVTVRFPQMPYVGFWHMPEAEAPYVCIEPWSSLPARQDVVECFEEKDDLISLPAGQVYENNWSITICQ